jgi:FAD synthase
MKIIPWSMVRRAKKSILNNVALTVGVFDGLHLGHQKLIFKVVNNRAHLQSVVVTFKDNPLKVLQTRKFSGDILTDTQKMAKLKALGVMTVVPIDFSYDFSRISAEDFFNSLATAFTIKEMVVGYNFHFGHGKKADIKVLGELTAKKQMSLEVIRPVTYKKQIISSTRIRKAIDEGNFAEARAMLGCEYIIQLPVKNNAPRNEGSILFKREEITQILPKKGRYWCLFNPLGQKREGEVEIKDKELICSVQEDIPITSLCFIKSMAKDRNL